MVDLKHRLKRIYVGEISRLIDWLDTGPGQGLANDVITENRVQKEEELLREDGVVSLDEMG